MAKSKKLSAECVRLNDLIKTYGLEAVMAATGWKMGTLNQYIRDFGTMNVTRLDIAEKVLSSTK